jgi:outer membrane protein, heavy metal efflux system
MRHGSWAVCAAFALAGCATPQPTASPANPAPSSQPTSAFADIRPVAHTEPAPTVADAQVPADQPLGEPVLIRAVLERNPTLEEMRAAVVAAEARIPQAASYDDPMVGVWTAPGSYWSPNVNPAARVEVSQKLPWPGKREVRAAAAAAEAGAAVGDLNAARLELVEAVRAALADYYLAERGLVVNQEARALLTELRQNAVTRAKTALGVQQDILQADVELARRDERAVALERARRVARARLNTLLHRPADAPLGPPPEALPAAPANQDPAALRAQAVAARPDLKALGERIRAEEAALVAAGLEYQPDVEVMAAYDSFWQGAGGRPLQWQLGARVNIPIQTGRREGAVVEAQARLARRRAELTRLTDQVGFQVQEAYEQVRAARQVIEVYDQKVLPAARANIKEARAAYANNRVPFLTLSQAQQALTDWREKYLEAQAELYRRQAALDRVTGKAVGPER